MTKNAIEEVDGINGISRYGNALIREFISFVRESEGRKPVGVNAQFISPGAFSVEYYYEKQDSETDDK